MIEFWDDISLYLGEMSPLLVDGTINCLMWLCSD